MTCAGAITASTMIGGAGNDTFNFGAGVSNTSIVGGDGVNIAIGGADASNDTLTTPSPLLV